MPQSCPVALKASGGAPDRHVEAELVLARPHVGAVAVDHERQIAEQGDAVGLPPRRPPLRAGEPLEVLVEQHFVHQLAPGAIDRRRVAPLKRLWPLRPRPLLLARVERPKQA